MKPFNRKYFVPLVHAFIWLGLFLYPFLFHYLPFSDYKAVARISILLLLVMGQFYLNIFVLIPRLLGRKKVALYLLSVIALISAVSFVSAYTQVLLNPAYEKNPSLFNTALNTAIIASVLAWFSSSIMKLTSEWYSNQQRMQAVENEKLNTELSFLKSQVNPHFLFNALNNIYSLENKKSPETGNAILKLSHLVRYMLYETSAEMVPLEKELDYIRNYIELQKLGLNASVKADFSIRGNAENLLIQPMLLIPLIENVFKHGISYKGECHLKISISITEKILELTTENPISSATTVTRQGIGIENLKKRLGLLYPGKYNLQLNNGNGVFTGKLQIALE